MSFTLATLSDDALCLILERSCIDVVTLWLTGDASLNARIARSCKSIRSSPSVSLLRLQKWPRMFAQLTNLQTLQFSVFSIEEAPSAILAQLQLLNPGITTLQLHFGSAPLVPILSDPLPKSDTVTTFWNLGNTFPLLQCIAFTKPKRFYNRAFDNLSASSWCQIFPPSMQEIRWSGNIWWDETHFSRLPRGLKALDIDAGIWGEMQTGACAASLPRGLTRLTGICAGLEAVANLPQSLASPPLNHQLTPEILAALPPSTRSIAGLITVRMDAFADAGVQWSLVIPRALERLEIFAPGSTVADLAQLPDSLTTLGIFGPPINDILQRLAEVPIGAPFKLWPSQLTTLRIFTLSFVSDNSEDVMKLFPSSLTQLLLHVDGHIPTCFWSALPPKLRKLKLYPSAYTPFDLPGPLPEHLTYITINEAMLKPSSFSLLPSNLKVLSMNTVKIKKANEMALLPRSITKLRLETVHPRVFSVLPPNLTHLALSRFDSHLVKDVVVPPSLLRVSVNRVPDISDHCQGIFDFGVPQVHRRKP